MCTSSPDTPDPVPVLPEAPVAPNTSDSFSGKDADKRRRRMAAGQTGTLLTGSRGLETSANTETKVLLGA